MHVQTISSERLDLVWMSPEFLQACIDSRVTEAGRLLGAELPSGWLDDHARSVLARRLGLMKSDPENVPWLGRAMLRRSDGAFIGDIGFHYKPNARGQVEMGYMVCPEYRRQGFAGEAARALMAWATRQHGIRRFIVSISPSNAPSLALAAKLGFGQIGTQIDEIDGEEYVFELVVEG